jgi:ssDNA-binding Zn-finger/Zn-ribbon topoisomerase 1
MNGPFEKVKCDYCLTETGFAELDDHFWEYIFESSEYDENSGSLENTYKLDLKWSNPKCSKCKTDLEIANYNFDSEDPVICSKCSYENTSYPAPVFLKEDKLFDLTAQYIFCAEKEGEKKILDQTEVKPIAFQCVSCAAKLSVNRESPRNYECEHCGTTQYLPDPIWKALHPVKKRRAWYIRFA